MLQLLLERSLSYSMWNQFNPVQNDSMKHTCGLRGYKNDVIAFPSLVVNSEDNCTLAVGHNSSCSTALLLHFVCCKKEFGAFSVLHAEISIYHEYRRETGANHTITNELLLLLLRKLLKLDNLIVRHANCWMYAAQRVAVRVEFGHVMNTQYQ